MKRFYLHNGTEQEGPFDITDLKTKRVKKETPIWHEGLSDWTTAGKVDELTDLFVLTTPPPFSNTTEPPPLINKQSKQEEKARPTITSKPKKNNTIRTVMFSIIMIVVGLLGYGFLGKLNHGSADASYIEKVMTVEEIERANPTNFLNADGTFRKNFWGNKFKVNCIITNKATVASYKDAVVRITYYSKTNTELGSKDYTIYEVFPPHSTKTVELKIDNYKDVSALGWDVIQASVR